MEIDRELIRYLLLIGGAPLWWPFLKALWTDFNRALREEGGLFGAAPAPRELERIRRENAGAPETLVSEPWVRPGEQRRPRLPSRGASPPAPGPAQRPAPSFRKPEPKRFRS